MTVGLPPPPSPHFFSVTFLHRESRFEARWWRSCRNTRVPLTFRQENSSLDNGSLTTTFTTGQLDFTAAFTLGLCADVQMCVTLSLEDKMYWGTVISADLRSLNLEVMTLGSERKILISPCGCSVSLFLHSYMLPHVSHLSFPSSCPFQKVLP